MKSADKASMLKDLLTAFDALNAQRKKVGMRPWSDATLGAYAVNNPKLVPGLRSGSVNFVQEYTFNRARAWIRAERRALEVKARKAGKGRARK